MDSVVTVPPPLSSTAYRGAFVTLAEETTIATLRVEGRLPAWLRGTLVRNGPGCFEVGEDRYRHWFDGLAMLHRFTFADAGVSYANRYLRSPAYLDAQRLGRVARSEFGTDPRRSFADRIASLFRDTVSHNASVSAIPWGDRMLALTETIAPVPFDAASLANGAPIAYDDDVRGQLTTAHWHLDTARDLAYNFVTELGRKSFYHVVAIRPGTFTRVRVGSIAVDEPAYMHSFAMTAEHVIVCEFPYTVKLWDLALRRKPFYENFQWKPERGARFHVMRKRDGTVRTYEAESFFAFHHVNAFEERDALVLDVVAYPDARIIDGLALRNVTDPANRTASTGTLRRYHLPNDGTTATFETLAPTAAVELPQIDRTRSARAYRYAYGLNVDRERPEAVANQIVKADVVNRTTTAWSEPGSYPGEALFVAPPDTNEDDGVLLTVVFDALRGTSALVVLDARDMTERARVHVPHHIPYGFHGSFQRAT
jgi:carotenoid cleavage dioxygenase-like enzyme